MTIEIKFSKRRYHEQDDMHAWCIKNIGKGGWSYTTPSSWDELHERRWVMHSMFGSTTFAFRHSDDATAFKLVWGNDIA